MIATREQQQRLLGEYNSDGSKSTDEYLAFAAGMDAAFALMDKLLKEQL